MKDKKDKVKLSFKIEPFIEDRDMRVLISTAIREEVRDQIAAYVNSLGDGEIRRILLEEIANELPEIGRTMLRLKEQNKSIKTFED